MQGLLSDKTDKRILRDSRFFHPNIVRPLRRRRSRKLFSQPRIDSRLDSTYGSLRFPTVFLAITWSKWIFLAWGEN